jgi:WD40 repeat protein
MNPLRAVVVAVGRFSSDVPAGDEAGYGFAGWPPLSFVYDLAPRVGRALADCSYEVVELVDPDRRQFRDAVESAIEQGSSVVHIISHGRASEKDPTRLDVVPASGGFEIGMNVTEWVSAAEHAGRPVLFLLDLCRSGRAARLPFMLQLAGWDTSVWVIAAAGSRQDAFDGRFSSAVAEALEQLTVDGLGTDPSRPYVSFSTFARSVGRRIESMPGIPQRVHASVLDPAQDEPVVPFFRNPRHVDDPRQRAREALEPSLRVFADDLDEVLDARHFRDRVGAHFTGRHRELRALTAWLDGEARGAPALTIVTGSPGVGKSALIGALVCAAHPALAAGASALRDRLGELERPRVDEDLAAVHARQRRLSEVMASLGRQLRSPEPPGGWTPPRLIEALGKRTRSPAIVLDALDEALDPTALMTVLLIPLAQTRRPGGGPLCRLLVGMRPWEEFAPLRELAEPGAGVVDLDRVRPAELRDDLRDYIRARLGDLPGYPGTRVADAAAARLVPGTADRHSWGEFLVAAVFCRYLASVPPPADAAAAERLGETVPQSLPAVLELDLAAQAGGPAVRAVLAAFAFAKGDGLPAELAASVALAFGGVGATEALLATGRFYLRTAVDRDGVTLYRLFHQGLADYLRRHPRRPARWDEDAAAPSVVRDYAGVVFDRLTRAYTSAPAGSSPWQLAPPYLLRHAIQHAAEADRVDDLLLDADFLVHAEPATLGPELRNAGSGDAQLVAAVYRTSASVHRQATPPDRRWLLAIDALRYQADTLAARIAPMAAGRWQPWWATGSKLSKALRDTLTGHAGPVNAVACATIKGRDVAVTAGRDGTVRIWDLASAEQVGHSLTGHRGSVDRIVVPPGAGRPLAVSGGRDGTVRVWDLAHGEQDGPPLAEVAGSVTALTCGSAGDGVAVVVAGDRAGHARAWTLPDRLPYGTPIRGAAGAVTALAWIAQQDGPVVIVGDRSPTVGAYRLGNGRLLDRTSVDAGPVTVAFARAASIGSTDVLLVDGRDGLVLVRFSWQGLFSANVGTSGEQAVAVSEATVDADSFVIRGTRPGTVELALPDFFRSREKHLVRRLHGHAGQVRDIAVTSVSGRTVAVTAGDDETVRVWDLVRGIEEKDVAQGHVGTVTAAACVRGLAVTGGRDGRILAWDLPSGEAVGRSNRNKPTKNWWERDAPEPSQGHVGPVKAIAAATLAGKPVAVSAGRDRTLRRWRLPSVRQIGPAMLGHQGPVNTVAVIRVDGADVAVSGGEDAKLLRWEVETGRRIGRPLAGHTAPVTAVAGGVVGGLPVAVSAGRDGSIVLWDVPAGQEIRRAAAGTVTGIGTAEVDGTVIAFTAGADGAVRLWELATLSPIGPAMTGHTGHISATTFVRKGNEAFVATGARDRTMRFWDPRSRRCADQLIFPSPLQCATAAADGSLLVCADWEVIVLR